MLTGTIPTLLSGLLGLFLSSNLLVGSIPLMPLTLRQLYLSQNQLSGCIPSMPYVNYIDLSDNSLLEGSLNVIRISNTSISELIHNNVSVLTTCNLNNTALLGKVDEFTQCARSNLFTTNSNCGITSYLYSNFNSYTLHSTSIDLLTSAASPISAIG